MSLAPQGSRDEKLCAWPKRCKCGLSYWASGWESLPMCGRFEAGPIPLELRNCACGSTIAVDQPMLRAGSLFERCHLARARAVLLVQEAEALLDRISKGIA